MVQSAEQNGIKATARIFKADKNTVKLWLRRWREEGYEGLEDRSRRPKKSPNAITKKRRKEIVKLKERYKRMGADQIKIIENMSESARTIRKIWREEGVSSRKRRKKHETKRNLRDIKKEWRLFQQIDEDTKDLTDIPEYWIQIKKKGLPKWQYTARDVSTGMLYMGFANERSLSHSSAFAEYLNQEIQKCGGDLSRTTRQTDNGSEYIGSWQAKSESVYTQVVESVKGQKHKTIPAGAHRWQADVETVHDIIERDFFEIEEFKDRKDLLGKYKTFQMFFNLIRPNTYKENKTPWQLAKEKQPDIPIDIAMIPPVDVDELLEKNLDFFAQGGENVPSNPYFIRFWNRKRYPHPTSSMVKIMISVVWF